jgi:hypothetical protein
MTSRNSCFGVATRCGDHVLWVDLEVWRGEMSGAGVPSL